MGGSSHLSFAVGSVVMVGGVYAFVAKKSLASLMGASMVAGPMVLGGALIMNGHDFYGHALSATSSVGLVAIGWSRYKATKGLMPALPMMAVGLISLAYHETKAFEWL